MTQSASGNSVTVESGAAVPGTNGSSGSIYGGYATNGNAGFTADGNTVTIKSGGIVDGGTYGSADVYGGYANDNFGVGSPTSASGNTVTIDGGGTALNVYGGYAMGGYNAVANDNVVTISNATTWDVYGGWAPEGGMNSTATANGNFVTINDSTVNGNVYGGSSFGDIDYAIASDNTVTINGTSTVSGNIYGGYINSLHAPIPIIGNTSIADTNTVIIRDGVQVTGDVYGGYTYPNSAGPTEVAGNSVTVENGSSVTGNVFGGGTDSDFFGPATVANNTVTINSGTVSGAILGGSGGWNYPNSYYDITVTGNTVNLNDSSAGAGIYGGYANTGSFTILTATASGNTVNLKNSTASNSVYGGWATSSTGNAVANGNTVTISGGNVDGNIYGGYAASSGTATATGNTVTISGDPATGANPTFGANTILYGGYTNGTGDAFTGNTLNLNAAGVTVAGMQNFQYLNFNLPANLGNGGVMLNVTGNASLGDPVLGGSTVNAIVLGDNQTIAPGDTVRLIQGGNVISNGFTPTQVQNTDNGLTTIWKLSTDATSSANGTYLDAFLKSMATPGDLARSGGFLMHSSATESVSLSVGGVMTVGGPGLTVDNSAGGGVAVNIGTLDASASDTTVTLTDTSAWNGTSGVLFNTLNLGGSHTFTLSGTGGYTVNTYNVFGPATFNGNLNAAGSAMNFYVPTSMGNGGTMLTVTGTANVAGSQVHVGINGASTPLQTGDHVVLINAASLAGAPANGVANATGMQGVTLMYNFDLLTPATGAAPNQLWAVLTPPPTPPDKPATPPDKPATPPDKPAAPPNNSEINPPSDQGNQPKVYVNPEAKSLSEGFLSGMALLNQGGDLVAGWAIGAASGAAIQGEQSVGYGVFGTIFGGWSRYNTGSHADMSSISLMTGLSKRIQTDPGNLVLGAFFQYGNGSYDTYTATHGDGDLNQVGGGIIGRMDFTDTKTGHFYGEGSARLGRVDNDYKNGELRDFSGRAASYDSSSPYYGIHLGAGYVWGLTDKATLELYGKYFWTHQDGDTVRLSTGDPVDFDAVNSNRLRVGGRFNYAVNEKISPYVGVAYGHEFSGDAAATTNGYAIGVPSLRGGTGIAELGLIHKPLKNLPVYLDLGIQGYAGTREGFAGTLYLHYDF